MSYEQTCAGTGANTGVQTCKLDWGQPYAAILCPSGFSIADETTAKLEATWTAEINRATGSRIKPLPPFFSDESTPGDITTESGRAGKISKLFTTATQFVYNLTELNLAVHQNVFSNENRKWEILIITDAGYIIGNSPDGTKFEGIKLQNFFVRPVTFENDSNAARTQIQFQFEDAEIMGKTVKALKPDFDPTTLDGINNVDIAITASSQTAATFAVTREGETTPYIGLVQADMDVLFDGSTLALSTFTDNADGTYDITYVSTGAGTLSINLKNQPDMTTKGVESTGAQTATLS